MEELHRILDASLPTDNRISFDSLHLSENLSPFVAPSELGPAQPPKRETFISHVRPRTFLEKLLRLRKRYERDLQEAEARFSQATSQFLRADTERRDKLAALQIAHETANQRKLSEIKQHNTSVDQFRKSYESAEPFSITTYCSMVLERSRYPDGFPQNFRLAYVPASKELVVEYELPTANVVPHVSECRYVKTKDTIEEKLRKMPEIKETYQDIVAALALRTIRELFDSDQCNHFAIVVFNGFVSAVDPATGQNIKPYLISVRTTKERFAEIDLRRIEKKACLRNLGAQGIATANRASACKTTHRI